MNMDMDKQKLEDILSGVTIGIETLKDAQVKIERYEVALKEISEGEPNDIMPYSISYYKIALKRSKIAREALEALNPTEGE